MKIEQWKVRKNVVSSLQGAVASQHWLASRAGAAMLGVGGNAVDASVACALALGVVEPWMCGLGGSGFMVCWDASQKKGHVLDFQGVLPRRVSFDDYPLDSKVPLSQMGFPGVLGRRNSRGYTSITVPGAVAGFAHALERFGTMAWDRILVPTIDLVRRGLTTDWYTTLHVALESSELARDPGASEVYLPDGLVPVPEQNLKLGNLARTLERLAEFGPDEFYRGMLAREIAFDLARGGSCLDAEDLADYRVLELDPLYGTHRGAELLTAGETSGGLRLLESLAWVEQHLDPSSGLGPQTWLTYAESLNLAFQSHSRCLGLSNETGCTTHVSAIDREGGAAALTFTLLDRFGSKVVLPSSGMLMNNGVSYFDPRPGFSNSIEGGKRVKSSNMCPTLALRDGEVFFAVGASGANHIVPCTMQIIGFLLDYGLSIEEAMHLPRVDAWGGDTIRADPELGEETLKLLSEHFMVEIAQSMVFPKLYACPSGVQRDPERGRIDAISDPTHPKAGGAAAGSW